MQRLCVLCDTLSGLVAHAHEQAHLPLALTALVQHVLADAGAPTIHRAGFWESLARSHA